MTIDEAIAHAREAARKQRKDNDNCKYKLEYGCKGCADYYSKPCIECAKEHEQLAEWLEELKDYRDKNKMVVRIDCIGTEEFKDMAVKLAKQQYDRGIDDFKKELFKNSERARPVGWLGYSEIVTCEKIYDIAEKLKESEQHIQKDKRDFEVVEEFFTDSKEGDRK